MAKWIRFKLFCVCLMASNLKIGSLVRLREEWPVPGALTAIKFYQRLKDEVSDKNMLVLAVHDKSVLVLLNGYKKVLSIELIEVVHEY